MKLILGTRGSALALKQSDIVARALGAAQPGLEVEIQVIETTGDKNMNPIPLDTVGKGWFTREIEDALADGRIDLAVHSLKDMGEEQPAGLAVAAYPEREDARDALVSKSGETLEHLPHSAVIGTDSVRRGVQLRALRPDVEVKSVRGNVPTRLQKLESGYDAVVLAVAGLRRLGLQDRITEIFDTEKMTPAPGQGILAVQARDGDIETARLLACINDTRVAAAAHLERSFARAAGAGCKSPVGAYAVPAGEGYMLTGMLASDDGTVIVRDSITVAAADATAGATLAEKLLARLHAHA